MTDARRITLGHGVMQLGIGIRIVAGWIAGSCLVAFLAGIVVIPLAEHGAYLQPFSILSGPRHSGDLVTWLWQGALVTVAVALVGRAVAVLTGALGWSLLPERHRELLTRLTEDDPTAALASAWKTVEDDDLAAAVMAPAVQPPLQAAGRR